MPLIPPGALLSLAGAMLVATLLGAWIWAITRVAAGEPLLHRRPIVPAPWGGTTVLSMILLWLVLQVLVAVAFLQSHGRAKTKPSPADTMAMATVASAAALVALPLALRWMTGVRREHFGLGRWGAAVDDLASGVAVGTIVYPLVFALMVGATRVWPPRHHPLEDLIRGDPSGRVALMALLSAVLLGPAVEEFLFRGILQGWLIRLLSGREPPQAAKPETGAAEPAGSESDAPAAVLLPDPDRSPWSAPMTPIATTRPGGAAVRWAPLMPNLLTSVLFAAIHGTEWPAPIPLFFLSLGLGYVFERTGGLLAPFALHATFNAISTLLLFVAVLSGGEPAKTPVPKTACVEDWATARRAGTPGSFPLAHRGRPGYDDPNPIDRHIPGPYEFGVRHISTAHGLSSTNTPAEEFRWEGVIQRTGVGRSVGGVHPYNGEFQDRRGARVPPPALQVRSRVLAVVDHRDPRGGRRNGDATGPAERRDPSRCNGLGGEPRFPPARSDLLGVSV